MSDTVPSLSAVQVEVSDSTSLQQANVEGYPIGVQSIFVVGDDSLPSNVTLPVMAPYGFVYFQGHTTQPTCTLPPGSSVALAQSITVINQNPALDVIVFATPPDKLGEANVRPLTNKTSLLVSRSFYNTFTWTGAADEGGQGYWMRAAF
jgi:hypothetical protein